MSPTERRTTALRGPGAGGFTPPTSVAASNPCLNCGTNIQLEFCPECGQREIDTDPTLREFLAELAEEFLHWDGKLFKTYRMLLTKPGQLTMAYLEGRRVRYVSPLRVYLSCSILFFFLSTVAPRQVVIDRTGRPVAGGIVQVGRSTPQDLAEIDADARRGSAPSRFWKSHMARALRDPENLQHDTLESIPKAMFVLVPFFALLVGLVYRDRRRKYPQHLAFALHIHAALFLTLSVMLGGRFFGSPVASGIYQVLFIIPFAIYLVRATRKVYPGSAGQTVWRLSAACAMYFGAFVAILTALFALIVLSY